MLILVHTLSIPADSDTYPYDRDLSGCDIRNCRNPVSYQSSFQWTNGIDARRRQLKRIQMAPRPDSILSFSPRGYHFYTRRPGGSRASPGYVSLVLPDAPLVLLVAPSSPSLT